MSRGWTATPSSRARIRPSASHDYPARAANARYTRTMVRTPRSN